MQSLLPSLRSNGVFTLLFLLLTSALIFIRCQKFIPPENESMTSQAGDGESHNAGQNCMNCHYSEGQGEGWFTVAGTVQGNFTGALVHIYADSTQSPVKTIEIDALGNFYTTDPIDISAGIFAAIELPDGSLKKMPDQLFTGQCNLCHGVTTGALGL